MFMLSEIFHDPALAVKNFKKQPSLNNALGLMAFSAFLVMVTLVVFGLRTNFSFESITNNFWSAIYILAIAVAYSFLVKIPYEIITDKKQDSFAYALSATSMSFSMISIGLLLFSILVLVSSYISPSAYFGSSHGIEYYLSMAILAIGLFIFLWFLMKGLSSAVLALKEYFETDYITVLLINGITATILTVMLYAYLYIAFKSIFSLMGGGLGKI